MKRFKTHLNKFLRSGFLLLLLSIFYTIIFSLLNFPTLFLIVPFLIALIVIRFKLTGKILTIFTSLGYLILSGVLIRTYIQEARYIMGNSMMPALKFNDRVLVDKLRYYFQEPQHGDIIIFSPTEELKQIGFEDSQVRRIVGLPNERVEMREGHIYIDNQLYQENYSVKPSKSQSEPIIVPKRMYVVIHDDREDSPLILVPRDNIVGRVKSIFWPIERNSLIQ